jgi:hypothetical protein
MRGISIIHHGWYIGSFVTATNASTVKAIGPYVDPGPRHSERVPLIRWKKRPLHPLLPVLSSISRSALPRSAATMLRFLLLRTLVPGHSRIQPAMDDPVLENAPESDAERRLMGRREDRQEILASPMSYRPKRSAPLGWHPPMGRVMAWVWLGGRVAEVERGGVARWIRSRGANLSA